MSAGLVIRRVGPEPGLALRLAELLVDVVEGGSSVGFMSPLTQDRAISFWEMVLASGARGERIVFVAEDEVTGTILGTVQILFAVPENQPHRADIAKLQVRQSARRRGIGAALMAAVEKAALETGKTVLVLDTTTGSDAELFYTRLGWERCGVIPDYALMPKGGLSGTTVFYRKLNPDNRPMEKR
jgi:GNAT superfamily N-acetyltransferase